MASIDISPFFVLELNGTVVTGLTYNYNILIIKSILGLKREEDFADPEFFRETDFTLSDLLLDLRTQFREESEKNHTFLPPPTAPRLGLFLDGPSRYDSVFTHFY